jgi:hypothetical protein
MRAFRLEGFERPATIRDDVPVPAVTGNEVLVRIHGSSAQPDRPLRARSRGRRRPRRRRYQHLRATPELASLEKLARLRDDRTSGSDRADLRARAGR